MKKYKKYQVQYCTKIPDYDWKYLLFKTKREAMKFIKTLDQDKTVWFLDKRKLVLQPYFYTRTVEHNAKNNDP